MENPKDFVARELESLRRTHDELRVKLHLASQDAKNGWDKLERMLLELEDNAKQLAQSGEPAKLGDTARQLVADIKAGYQRFLENAG
jgi:hypothetical protein